MQGAQTADEKVYWVRRLIVELKFNEALLVSVYQQYFFSFIVLPIHIFHYQISTAHALSAPQTPYLSLFSSPPYANSKSM